MFDNLLDLLFPRTSLLGESWEWITPSERRMLHGVPIVEEEARLRRRGVDHLHQLTAACSYRFEPLIQKAIYLFKYHRIDSVVDVLTNFLLDSKEGVTLGSETVLCPVPLHWTRRFDRGFNQAALLAQGAGQKLGLPVRELLRRVRPTGHQAWRDRKERMLALEHAFVVRRGELPEHVILIDDLSTTGATLDACACALRASGVSRVDGWVVAKG